MSEAFTDLGFSEPEPDTPLIEALRQHPELVALCKERGWWRDTIAKLEEGR